MGNIIELDQFRNNPIYHYVLTLGFQKDGEQLYSEMTEVLPFLIKPFPPNDFLLKMTQRFIKVLQHVCIEYEIHPHEIRVEDFSVYLKEQDTYFHLKNFIPKITSTPLFHSFMEQ